MRNLLTAGAVTLLLAGIPLTGMAQPVAIDPHLLMQMQETIRQQQEQLRRQAEQIRLQSQKLDALQQQISALQQPPVAPAAASTAAVVSPAKSPVPAPPVTTVTAPSLVVSGNDRVKLAISGQVNRAMMIADDGYNTTTYQVDNNATDSRVRFVGLASLNNDLSVGARIEVAITPDRSSQVSQKLKTSGDFFDQRWVELSLQSKTFGKLSIGKGDTASNDTAEVDLSRTDVVQYSNISDISGGFLFRERNGSRPLTTLKVSDAFKNFDGLSRQSRLRYDSPALFGFSIAGSLVSNQRSDLAILWGGAGYGFKAAGAFAVSNPKADDAGLLYDGSYSLLHQATGLNLTLSGGLQRRASQRDATNLYAKLGWLTNLTTIGSTAFGVDYTYSENLPSSRDKGYSIGAAVVQMLQAASTELYLQYRIFSLDRVSGPAVGNINVGIFGARVKF